MCNWGETVDLSVTVPAHLSHTGSQRVAVKPIDRCIAPIVAALNGGGVLTASSCCGHGRGDGSIILADGRELLIRQACGGSGVAPNPQAATRETVAKAMQMAWDDFVGDTGCYPDCFERRGGKLYADFGVGNFATMVAGWLTRAAAPSTEPAP